MALFKKRPQLDFVVAHADNADGYARLKLATYRDELAHQGIRSLGKKPVKSVGFQIIKERSVNGINVYANDNRIGTIWRDSWTDYFKAIKTGKVRAAHVDIIGPDEVYLYIAI